MVSNAIFNNISVISWWSVLLMEETGVLDENHKPTANHRQTSSHNVVSSTLRHERESQLYWWFALIAQVVVNPNIRSWPRRPVSQVNQQATITPHNHIKQTTLKKICWQYTKNVPVLFHNFLSKNQIIDTIIYLAFWICELKIVSS
jgi:hypothetical protein